MAEENTNEENVEEQSAPAAEETPAVEEKAAEEAAPASEKADPKAEKASSDAPAAEGEENKEDEPAKSSQKKDIFAEILGEEDPDKVKVFKAKGSKNISKGIVTIAATFNNTIVTITDEKGDVIGWSSAGKMGFKGSRKSTSYAGQVVSQDACRQAMSHGLKEAEVRVKGPGQGRESAARAVQNVGIMITKIKDVTPVPHNGCRPKKARRV